MRFALALFFAFLAIPSGETADDSVLRLFEAHYSSAHTLQATFLERYTENGRLIRAEAGKAYFLKPGKMRWDYESPEKNTFLVDGKYVWFYSPADHTATRMPAKSSEDWRTPLAFFTSHMKLSRLCSQVETVQGEKPSRAGGLVYRCTLREPAHPAASPENSVIFEISPAGELNRIVAPQEGGIELEFSFADWLWNPPLGNTVFQFIASPDTVIVNGVLPEAPGLRQ